MRQIGHIESKTDARVFSDYLYACGVENEVEVDGDRWAVWVADDDDVIAATAELERFAANPKSPQYEKGASEGRKRWKEEKKDLKSGRDKVVDVRTTWGRSESGEFLDGAFLTIGLMVISIGVYAVNAFNGQLNLYSALTYGNLGITRHLISPVIFQGQIWRLITPIFLHFGLMHIVFNLLWLKDLGWLIEVRHGTWYLAVLVLLFAIPSNMGQYWVSGPNFGGMSGVVYGLLGFIWLRGKLDPQAGYQLPQYVVWMMLAWFFICLTGLVGNIANTAHGVGLILGATAGYITARIPKD